MPHLGPASLRRIATCDPRLQLVCRDVIKVTDFAVTCGHRTLAEQVVKWEQGRTTPGKIVTWAKPGESVHGTNPSRAIDLAPFPIDWDNEQRFIELGGMMLYAAALRGIALEWGGHWSKRRRDLPHYQVPRVNFRVPQIS